MNEGVDLPSVDTVLFLRPTESATVFLQQLGRGLRLAPILKKRSVLRFSISSATRIVVFASTNAIERSLAARGPGSDERSSEGSRIFPRAAR